MCVKMVEEIFVNTSPIMILVQLHMMVQHIWKKMNSQLINNFKQSTIIHSTII